MPCVGQGGVSQIQNGAAVLDDIHLAAEGVGAAKEGLDFGYGYVQLEGLGDKVVAAHVDSHDKVHVVAGGGNENDGHFGEPADFLTPVVAVVVGEGDVQQDKLGVEGEKFLQNPAEIGHGTDAVAPAFEAFVQHPGNGQIVFDDENFVHKGAPFREANAGLSDG